MDVPEILETMAGTFRERGKQYGHNYMHVGPALAALFPDGLWLRSAEDFARFATFAIMMTKQSRYAVNFESGGHQDSVHDLAVYAAILEHQDFLAQQHKIFEKSCGEFEEMPFEQIKGQGK